MTSTQDFIVGCLAIFMGTFLIGGALIESPMLLGLTKSKLLVESVGKNAARWILAGIGAGSIALGLLIASGWRPHW
jgi:hypothetical protein